MPTTATTAAAATPIRRFRARLRALAVDADLDPELAEKFLTFIVAEVVRHHEKIARGEG